LTVRKAAAKCSQASRIILQSGRKRFQIPVTISLLNRSLFVEMLDRKERKIHDPIKLILRRRPGTIALWCICLFAQTFAPRSIVFHSDIPPISERHFSQEFSTMTATAFNKSGLVTMLSFLAVFCVNR
jgi:hypothetical protein